MAEMPEIRAQAVSVLSSLKGNGDNQLRDILAYAPQSFNPLPLAYFGEATVEVRLGGLEVWHWLLPLYVLIAQTGDYASEMAHVEPFMHDIWNLIKQNVSLNSTIVEMKFSRGRQGRLTINGQDYVGFTMDFDVIDKVPGNYRHS